MSDAADAGAADDQHLIERFVSREVRLTGGFLTVLRDTVRLPDGGTATREYIRHPGAVAIVPILDDGRVVMVRQYRHPIGHVMLEWPAGKLDPHESVHACAIRELREETGFLAAEWARAGVFHNACAYSDEGIEIWFARGLRAGPTDLDAGEFVEASVHDPEDLLQQVHRGEITDMKTALGVLWLARWRSGGWTLPWQPAI